MSSFLFLFFYLINQFNHWCRHVPSTWKIGLSSIPERGGNAIARLRSIARLQPLRAASIMRLEDNSGDKECYETFLYLFLLWARLPHSTRSAVVHNGRISSRSMPKKRVHIHPWCHFGLGPPSMRTTVWKAKAPNGLSSEMVSLWVDQLARPFGVVKVKRFWKSALGNFERDRSLRYSVRH